MSFTIFITQYPESTREKDIEDLFSKYGKIDQVDMKKNYCFVCMDEGAARDAISGLNGIDFQGSKLIVQESKPKAKTQRPEANKRKCVTVENLNYDTPWQELKDYFKKAAEVVHVEIDMVNGKSTGTAMVELKWYEDVAKVVQQLDGTNLQGRKIRVKPAVGGPGRFQSQRFQPYERMPGRPREIGRRGEPPVQSEPAPATPRDRGYGGDYARADDRRRDTRYERGVPDASVPSARSSELRGNDPRNNPVRTDDYYRGGRYVERAGRGGYGVDRGGNYPAAERYEPVEEQRGSYRGGPERGGYASQAYPTERHVDPYHERPQSSYRPAAATGYSDRPTSYGYADNRAPYSERTSYVEPQKPASSGYDSYSRYPAESRGGAGGGGGYYTERDRGGYGAAAGGYSGSTSASAGGGYREAPRSQYYDRSSGGGATVSAYASSTKAYDRGPAPSSYSIRPQERGYGDNGYGGSGSGGYTGGSGGGYSRGGYSDRSGYR